MGNNITWHQHSVSRAEREKLNGHRGCVVWFTGLSASGKSTVANLVDRKLYERGLSSYLLDGDNVRYDLNAGPDILKNRHGREFAHRFGLGFSAQDREENIRRIGPVAAGEARPTQQILRHGVFDAVILHERDNTGAPR